MKDAVSRAHHVLVAISLAVLLALALTHAAPVLAQEETPTQPGDENRDVSRDQNVTSRQYAQSEQGSGQQAETSSCPTDADEVATFTNKDTSFGPFRITGESFEVLYDVQTDRETGTFRLAVTEDGETVTETATITELPVDDVLPVEDAGPGSFSLDIDASDGLDFAIAVCEAGGSGAAAEEGENGTAGEAADDVEAADELEDLSCDELLVLFRAAGSAQGQYGDASGFADADVRAQVEVCLENEIVKGTAADGDLPDTGGLSLIGLAVLGVAAAAAGLSVIRGGRR